MCPPPQLPVSQAAAEDAFASGDLGRIRFVLVDGSRCLDASWLLPRARELLGHGDPHVRWAALFALRQIRFEFRWDLLTRDRGSDETPIRAVADLAVGDLSPDVRSEAGTLLLELIEDFVAAR